MSPNKTVQLLLSILEKGEGQPPAQFINADQKSELVCAFLASPFS
jgi:hypothetical protein